MMEQVTDMERSECPSCSLALILQAVLLLRPGAEGGGRSCVVPQGWSQGDGGCHPIHLQVASGPCFGASFHLLF